jgi:hypothetical protein
MAGMIAGDLRVTAVRRTVISVPAPATAVPPSVTGVPLPAIAVHRVVPVLEA